MRASERAPTDLINNDTTKGDAPLPSESGLKQETATCAQRAADDVRLQDDGVLGFLWASLNLGQQKTTLFSYIQIL